ncbi:MAG: tetratricopeptide repeat protein [Gemmatimonadota bacterium]
MRARVRVPGWAAAAGLAILALAAALTGLRNGFTLDDVPIVAGNARVHTLAQPWKTFALPYWPSGGGSPGLYRPFGILGFALQWAVGGGKPVVFHAVNLTLAVGVTLAVYALARRLLSASGAWIAAALFAVHPVHVEVTANVVGQLELAVTLLLCVAVTAYLRWRGAGHLSARHIAGLAALYAAACLFKDTGFMLPALLLAAEWLVVADPRGLSQRVRALMPVYGALAVVAAGYLAARTAVTGTLAGDLPLAWLAALSPWARFCTMLSVVPQWLRLLVWPAWLSPTYTPPVMPIYQSLAGAPLLGLGLVGLAGLVFAIGLRRDRRVSFGIGWFALAVFPVSNVLLVSGVFLAERSLFLPSVGAMLVVGLAAARMLEARMPAVRVLAGTVAGAAIVLGAYRSASRQREWKDNETLFAQATIDRPDSYAAWWDYGTALFQAGKFGSGERALRRAIELHDRNPLLLEELAGHYREARMCWPAIALYEKALALAPTHSKSRVALVDCLLMVGDTSKARRVASAGVALGDTTTALHRWGAMPGSGARRAQ